MKAAMLALIFGVASAGCDNDGPAENLGEQVDDAVSEVQDLAEDAADEVREAADEIGDAVDQ